MVPIRYLEAVRGILDHLEQTQLEAIEQAATIVTESLSNGGVVYVHGIGHGNEGDFLNRAGGLAAVQHFTYSIQANAPVPKCLQNRPRPEPFEADLENIRYALRASNIRAGDVMVVGSVSGKNRAPIELALACREMGVKTIGFTSSEYTAQVESLHPSGKKLREVVDVAIDNGAPFGDGAVDIPGFDFKLLPVSGVSMTVIGWMIWGRVMEQMAAAGNPPTVFMSVNRPGGKEYYDQAVAEYQRRGY